jgi:hypothetical protein
MPDGAAPPAAPAPGPVDSQALCEKLLPALEESLANIGGAHWRLTDTERKLWLDLLSVAYPSFDPGRFARPVFWIVTLAIFGPRVILSFKQMGALIRDKSPVTISRRESRTPGKEGERQDVPGNEGGGVSPARPDG